MFPLDHYRGDIISDLFGDVSYFGDVDAFWALQNAAISSLKDELAGKGWKVTVLEKGTRFQSWQYEEAALEDGGGQHQIGIGRRLEQREEIRARHWHCTVHCSHSPNR